MTKVLIGDRIHLVVIVEMGIMEYSGLMHPNMEYSTKSGKVFFKMKRKDEWGPTYYIFDLNEEVLSDEEKTKFNKAWEIMTTAARVLGIKLFDSAEIMEALQAKIKEVLTSEDAEHAMAEADETGEVVLVRDIDISLFDHGTGRVTSLTIGISVPEGASEMMHAFS